MRSGHSGERSRSAGARQGDDFRTLTHGLDPEDYLTAVRSRLPQDATAEQAAALTPASLAEELKAARKTA